MNTLFYCPPSWEVVMGSNVFWCPSEWMVGGCLCDLEHVWQMGGIQPGILYIYTQYVFDRFVSRCTNRLTRPSTPCRSERGYFQEVKRKKYKKYVAQAQQARIIFSR